MKYNPIIVKAFFNDCGIPEPETEFVFHPVVKWRFDFAWPGQKVYLEVQGGLFIGGRHTRGAALIKEYEKLNNATMLGWRGLFFQPSEVCMMDTVKIIKEALKEQPRKEGA